MITTIPEDVLQRAMQRLVDEGRAELVDSRGRKVLRLTTLGLALRGQPLAPRTVQ